jgi:DNA polymerase III, gamma/tau subunits
MRGDAAGALAELSEQYAAGAVPLGVLRELAEIAPWISVVKVSPEAAEDPTAPLGERARARDLADRLPMRALTRTWQMLLKALEEAGLAPNAMMAAEMAVIRLTHVADLPSPEEIVRRLSAEGPPTGPAGGGGRAPATGGASARPVVGGAPRAMSFCGSSS